MRKLTSMVVMFAVVGMTTMVSAEEKASTGSLPAALQALGVESSAVVTESYAHQVRGQTGLTLTQDKSFSVSGGTAVGTTNLLEGVFGSFVFTQVNTDDMSTLVVEGAIGGLQGTIGSSGGELSFQTGGKALQETLNFAGKFEQNFSQWFGF